MICWKVFLSSDHSLPGEQAWRKLLFLIKNLSKLKFPSIYLQLSIVFYLSICIMYFYTKGTLHLHQSTHMKIFRCLVLLLILSATPLEASRYAWENGKRLSFTYNYIFVKEYFFGRDILQDKFFLGWWWYPSPK